MIKHWLFIHDHCSGLWSRTGCSFMIIALVYDHALVVHWWPLHWFMIKHWLFIHDHCSGLWSCTDCSFMACFTGLWSCTGFSFITISLVYDVWYVFKTINCLNLNFRADRRHLLLVIPKVSAKIKTTLMKESSFYPIL